MPLLNRIGDPLPTLILKPKDKKRLVKLENLKYPKDAENIFHLSPADFRDWIYSQPPQEVFSWDFVYDIRMKFEMQAKPTKFKMFKDFLWRMCH